MLHFPSSLIFVFCYSVIMRGIASNKCWAACAQLSVAQSIFYLHFRHLKLPLHRLRYACKHQPTHTWEAFLNDVSRSFKFLKAAIFSWNSAGFLFEIWRHFPTNPNMIFPYQISSSVKELYTTSSDPILTLWIFLVSSHRDLFDESKRLVRQK